MLINCPNCATGFSVPDKALQPKGRTLKCAKCGHKWFQHGQAPQTEFGLDENSFPPPPASVAPAPARPAAAERPFNPVRDPDPDLSFDTPPPVAAAQRADDMDMDLDLDEPPVPNLSARIDPDDRIADLDLDAAPQPIPDIFSSEPKTRKGTGGLWFLLFVLVLGGLAAAGYSFQDRVVDVWPPAHHMLVDMGLRRENPGAGLELRNAGTPERFVHNDTEVLIVRGIIANISDRERPVPTMKLVLLDKQKAPVQEKLQSPPVSALDPGGTAGFRIILERPDPNAVEVNVLFVDDGK